MKALDLKALRELRQMRSQTLTIALVVAAGVSILISFLSAYDSLRVAGENFYRTSRFAHVFATVKRAPRSLLPQIEAIPGVQVASVRIVFEASLDVEGVRDPVVGRFVSLPDQRGEAINKTYIRTGRLPASESLHEIVVSEGFALSNNLTPGSELAAVINGRHRKLTVVGTALSPEYVFPMRGLLPDDRHFGIMWMSEKTLSELLDMAGSWNSLSLLLERGASVPEVIRSVDRILHGYGGTGAIERRKHPSDFFLQNELIQLETMGWIIPAIFLGVAAFLLHIVIARLVHREREQIATLKALGYSNLRVATHYLTMVALMGFLGVLLALPPGIWIGQWYTEMYREFFRLPHLDFVFRPTVPAAAGLVAVGAATLGALGALREAFRLAPAEAMRPPAPTLFRRSILERAPISAVSKMAIRNFLMRPVRSALSILGLSLALSIVLIAFIYVDMIDFLLKFQFNVAQHEDATVVFNNNVSGRAIGELRSVPGVLYAEGYRVAPARLRNGKRTKDVSLYGIPSSARLKRLLDADLKYATIPPDGMLLNVRLARNLGLNVGDLVSVEFLEGERRTEVVPIAAVVEELLGAGAYFEIRALNRLTREEDRVSMAAITVDPEKSADLFSRLRRLPLVATVETRDAMAKVFQKMVTEMMLGMAIGMIVFASIIAVGVVYNVIMVALSERSWELASLRVLGFTRAEVFRVLTGEVVVQVVLCLPIGLLLGYYIMKGVMAVSTAEMEAYNFPIVVTPSSAVLSVLTLVTAAFLSALLVRRRIRKLDLVAVLKLRE